jgi:hypothetical protein
MNSVNNNTFNTPILFITFNRPTHTCRVWEEIKKQRPKYMFVFQDGAREGNEIDKEKCAVVRAIFEEPLDWDCELKTYFSDVNLGCGKGPATAITWFFENVEKGIIFEDDCLPTESLFRFYEELLGKYKYDNRVSLITANNLKLRWKSKSDSYIFATVGAATMGSWAGWARAWKMFEYDLVEWENDNNKNRIAKNIRNKKYYNYYSDIFNNHCKSGQTNVWDYQWFFARILNNTVSIVSTINQISNIGFGSESTHTPNPNDRIANLPVYNINFPMKHRDIKIDKLFDWVVFNRYYYPKKKSVLMKIALKLVEKFYCR